MPSGSSTGTDWDSLQEAGAATQEGVPAGDQGDAEEGDGEATAAGAGCSGNFITYNNINKRVKGQ